MTSPFDSIPVQTLDIFLVVVVAVPGKEAACLTKQVGYPFCFQSSKSFVCHNVGQTMKHIRKEIGLRLWIVIEFARALSLFLDNQILTKYSSLMSNGLPDNQLLIKYSSLLSNDLHILLRLFIFRMNHLFLS